jgi:hypothetical protein
MKDEFLKAEIIKLLDKFYSEEDDFEEEVMDLLDGLSELVDYNNKEEQ